MKTINWSSYSLFAIVALCVGVTAQAKVFECRDSQGRPLYTQQPTNSHCRTVNVRDTGTFSSVPTYTPPSTDGYSSSSTPTKVAANNNSSSSQIQAAQKQLDEARNALAEGKKVRNGNERNYVKYLERIKGLEDNVKQREQTLQQLKQQNSDGQ